MSTYLCEALVAVLAELDVIVKIMLAVVFTGSLQQLPIEFFVNNDGADDSFIAESIVNIGMNYGIDRHEIGIYEPIIM